MSLEDFEDSKNISLNSAILKVGKNIMAYIKNIDENNIVYLNRALLQSDYKKEKLENLKVGTVFNTTVISLASFGADVVLFTLHLVYGFLFQNPARIQINSESRQGSGIVMLF